MITRTFILAEHPEYGNIGLKMKGSEWSDPFDGIAVAHDILEHFPNDDGSIEAEFIALGASLYVRNFSHYYQMRGYGNRDVTDIIASEFIGQENYAINRGITSLKNPGNTKGCDADNYIDEIIRKGIEDIEYEANGDDAILADPHEALKIKGWMRKGYRKAAQRYKTTNPNNLVFLFRNIEKAVDKWLLHNSEYLGTELTISVSPKNNTFKFSAKIPD